MGVKADSWWKRNKGIIQPFREDLTEVNRISYGLSSAGYDISLSEEFLLFTDEVDCGIIDPKKFDSSILKEVVSSICIVPANSFVLARSEEWIEMPDNKIGLCIGKSTYARCGIIVNTTPLEPGWKGHLTIEISNTTRRPCKVYAKEGIAQLLLFEIDEPVNISYDVRKGKYQNQKGVTLPKIK